MHRDIANKIKELDSRLGRITKEKDQFNFLAVASLHPDQELKRVTTPFDVDATEIQVWVCVSDPFDQIKIAKAIVELTTKSSTDLSDRLQVLLEKIQTTLSTKRFLLVLDECDRKDAKWAPLRTALRLDSPVESW
nr:putative disease resistance protein RGA3 [Ipomoea batatas]